jgi:hypothetical protein
VKKKLSVLFVIFCVVGTLFAQEAIQEQELDKKYFLGIGWSTVQTTGDFWGSFDFSFLLYTSRAKRFNLRNSILFDGGSFRDNGVLILSERINMETISLNRLFRYYTFLQGGIGVYGNENKTFFETPLIYNFGIGFGLDVFIEKTASIFFDYAFLTNILDNKFVEENIINPKFQMGIRYYF